jgi:hypothetical protein
MIGLRAEVTMNKSARPHGVTLQKRVNLRVQNIHGKKTQVV